MAKKSYQYSDNTPIQVSEPAVPYYRQEDLKKLLREFYIQQIEKEADQFWVEGKISDALLNEHLRTPYK